MYLLDTDIVSNLIRRRPSGALLSKLDAVPEEDQLLSSITVGELLYGAYRLGTQGLSLLELLENLLAQGRTVLPFDGDAARRYARLRAELEQAGQPLAEADLRIASIALAGGLTLVTANVRHFARVPGLSVENWLEG